MVDETMRRRSGQNLIEIPVSAARHAAARFAATRGLLLSRVCGRSPPAKLWDRVMLAGLRLQSANERNRRKVHWLAGPSRYPARKATPRTTHHGQRYKRAVRGLHAVGDPEHAEKSFVQELGYLVSARRQNVEMRIEASAVTEWTSGCRDSRRR